MGNVRVGHLDLRESRVGLSALRIDTYGLLKDTPAIYVGSAGTCDAHRIKHNTLQRTLAKDPRRLPSVKGI